VNLECLVEMYRLDFLQKLVDRYFDEEFSVYYNDVDRVEKCGNRKSPNFFINIDYFPIMNVWGKAFLHHRFRILTHLLS